MSFDSRLRHQVAIMRGTPGAVDEYNQPTITYSAIATVPALIQPRTGREAIQDNEAGPMRGTYQVFMRPADVVEADHLICQDSGVDGIYEIIFVANAAGLGHHLELDATRVWPE